MSADKEIEEILKSIQNVRFLIQKIIRGTVNITGKMEPALNSAETVLIDARQAVANASNIFVEFSNYNLPIHRTYIAFVFLIELIAIGIILFLIYKISQNLRKLFNQLNEEIKEEKINLNKNNLKESEIPLLNNE
ncbi:hypothetical protein ACQ4LE_010240 [Meloidogyne hapla]|uniref:Uncharacterized protein n=1 Tax=Meloidogyne hapla TaxID=6305 RepID=A0A1I8B4X4_MELHA